jgi:hypothetical protein
MYNPSCNNQPNPRRSGINAPLYDNRPIADLTSSHVYK